MTNPKEKRTLEVRSRKEINKMSADEILEEIKSTKSRTRLLVLSIAVNQRIISAEEANPYFNIR